MAKKKDEGEKTAAQLVRAASLFQTPGRKMTIEMHLAEQAKPVDWPQLRTKPTDNK